MQIQTSLIVYSGAQNQHIFTQEFKDKYFQYNCDLKFWSTDVV